MRLSRSSPIAPTKTTSPTASPVRGWNRSPARSARSPNRVQNRGDGAGELMSAQTTQFGARSRGPQRHPNATQIGGYSRAGADQRLLRTVTRNSAGRRAERRLGVAGWPIDRLKANGYMR